MTASARSLDWHRGGPRAKPFHGKHLLSALAGTARKRDNYCLTVPGRSVRGANGPIQNLSGDVAQQQPAVLFSLHRAVLAKGRDGDDLRKHDHELRPSDAFNVSEGSVQVRTKIARNRTVTTDDITTAARGAARALVRREHARTMSRMLAYEHVASTIGTSSSWLRKFVNDYPDTRPDLVVGFNILAHYALFVTSSSSEGGNL